MTGMEPKWIGLKREKLKQGVEKLKTVQVMLQNGRYGELCPNTVAELRDNVVGSLAVLIAGRDSSTEGGCPVKAATSIVLDLEHVAQKTVRGSQVLDELPKRVEALTHMLQRF